MKFDWNPYAEYLASPEWIEKRNAAAIRDGLKCRMCGTGKNLCGHHIRYPPWGELGNEPLEDIITLCDECHKRVHSEDLKKNGMTIADELAEYLWECGFDEARGGTYHLTAGGLSGGRLPGLRQCVIDSYPFVPYAYRLSKAADAAYISYTAGEIICHRLGRALSEVAREYSYAHAAAALRIEPKRAYRIAKKYEARKSEGNERFNRLEGFIMKAKDWISVDAAGEFKKLPTGGYVMRITAVQDVPSREQLEIYYDIAEGPFAGFYATEPDWVCKTVKSYSERAAGFFRQFLDALAGSNPNFDIAQWQARGCNENEFVGLLFGALMQVRMYTNQKGADKSAIEVAGIVTADKVRSGDYKLPEPRDTRTNVGAPAQEPVPFDTGGGYGYGNGGNGGGYGGNGGGYGSYI